MASGGKELEQIQNIANGKSLADKLINRNLDPSLNQMIKQDVKLAPMVDKEFVKSNVTSNFSARPVNTVDTFGVNPVISNANILVDPASIPMTYEYSVNVPNGRTYFLRDFYFVPTRYIFDLNNNPIQDLFTLTFFVNDSPVSENSNLVFPSWGTGGYVESFFIAPANSVVKLRAQITNPAYVTLALPFPVYMGASISMRFNALLDSGAPPNLQVGNISDNQNTLGLSAPMNSGMDGIRFGNREYVRPK